jgi:hypothetical protein
MDEPNFGNSLQIEQNSIAIDEYRDKTEGTQNTQNFPKSDLSPTDFTMAANEAATPTSSAQPTQVFSTANQDDEEYSVFSISQKRLIIGMASLASFFSPLSSTIYFPALSTIAKDLHVTSSQVNLTVTTYLVRKPLEWTEEA